MYTFFLVVPNLRELGNSPPFHDSFAPHPLKIVGRWESIFTGAGIWQKGAGISHTPVKTWQYIAWIEEATIDL